MAGDAFFNELYVLEGGAGQLSGDMSRALAPERARLAALLEDETGAAQSVLAPDADTALLLALEAAGVQPRDSVLCSGFAPESVLRAIARAGASPMLVDINPNTYNLDPYCLDYVVGKCRRTQRPLPGVLVASDQFGLPCDYAALEDICARNEITLIEDMRESLGAGIGARKCGSFGSLRVLSFAQEPLSPLRGEAGAVLCATSAEARRVELCLERTRRADPDPEGTAGRDWARANLALKRLEEYRELLCLRRGVARIYDDEFQGELRTQQIAPGYTGAHSRYVVALPEYIDAQALIGRLHQQGIPCSQPWRHEQMRDDWEKVMLANSRSAALRLLVLPMHPHLGSRVARYIARQVLAELC